MKKYGYMHVKCKRVLRAEARHDPFLAKVLEIADTQRFMVNKAQEFDNGGFCFTLDTRCKWDWWLQAANFGGDLKTTAAATDAEFNDAIASSIGTVAVLGTWTSHTVIMISYTQYQSRTTEYLRSL